VEVRAASSSARALPGQPVALVMSWVAEAPPSTEIVWDVALLDPKGREVSRGTGVRHAATQSEILVSWFTLGIPAESPTGAYTARVRRLDPVGRSTSEWSSGPIDVFRE
jgi:hypothetical protein